MPTGHFGHKTLRTRTRHFDTGPDTSAPDRGKVGTLRTQDSSDDTGLDPPVVRLKLGVEVSGHFGTNFVMPKCLVAEVSGSRDNLHSALLDRDLLLPVFDSVSLTFFQSEVVRFG